MPKPVNNQVIIYAKHVTVFGINVQPQTLGRREAKTVEKQITSAMRELRQPPAGKRR